MMLYTWLLVVALAGAALADEDCCSTEDKKEIEWSWHKIWHTSYTDRKVKIMNAVFEELFDKNPDAKALHEAKGLGDHNSPAYHAYIIRVAHQFDVVINLLHRPDILEQYVSDLATKFSTKVNAKKHYFSALADALEHVLPKVSTCFNVQAWGRCFHRLSNVLSSKVTAE